MKNDILKIVLFPIMLAAVVVLIVSGIYSFVLLIKIAWNLMFHTVSAELLKKLVLSILLLIISTTVCELNERVDNKKDDKGDKE